MRFWSDDEGWGVIDSPDTPGGCWTSFSHVAVEGFKSLTAGELVELEWEAPGQDGYSFRAVRAWPVGKEPNESPASDVPGPAYGSSVSISWDEEG